MKICRECGFMKSDNYTTCPDCDVELEEFEGYE
jgi:rubrerythrin